MIDIILKLALDKEVADKEVEKLLQDLNYDTTYIGSEEINEVLAKCSVDTLSSKYELGTYTLSDILEEIKKECFTSLFPLTSSTVLLLF